MNNLAIFANRLNELMKENKISNRQLAKFINTSDVIILKWKRGKANPTLTNLCMLSQYFEVSIDYLAGLSDM